MKILLDTNIIIRLTVRDLEDQYKFAKEIIKKIETDKYSQAYLSILNIDEIMWVLENYYKLNREIFIPQLVNILNIENLDILEGDKNLIISCLNFITKNKIDFTDIYMYKISKQDKFEIISFDKKLKNLDKKIREIELQDAYEAIKSYKQDKKRGRLKEIGSLKELM